VPSGRTFLDTLFSRYQENRSQVLFDLYTRTPVDIQNALAEGTVDLALLDQEPAPFYLGTLTATLVAQQPIAVIVHRENRLSDLSAVSIVEILSGRVGNWNQVGGEGVPVQVYLESASTGALQAFEAEAMGDRRLAPNAIVRSSSESLIAAVAKDTGGIGLLPYTLVNEQVAVLRVDAQAPQEEDYPWHVALYLLYGPASPEEALRFIRFVERGN
jgi:ABC-type phosphate transport system substrate-binding protein